MAEVTGVAALVAIGLVLVLLLFVPFTLSAAELLLIFALIVFLSFIFASFYKQWAHSTLLMDEPPEREGSEDNRHTGAPRSANPREEAEVS